MQGRRARGTKVSICRRGWARDTVSRPRIALPLCSMHRGGPFAARSPKMSFVVGRLVSGGVSCSPQAEQLVVPPTASGRSQCRAFCAARHRTLKCTSRPISAGPASRLVVCAKSGQTDPPTVADTKKRFYEGFRRPTSPIYNTVIQELLVQQHIIRYNTKYHYDEVFAIGFVSVFDQILEGLGEGKEKLFNAYIEALDEDPKKYRADADKIAAWAKGLSGSDQLKPDAEGDDVQKLLADIAERAKSNKFLYSRFFAIGLFRMLELTGAKDPKALEGLVKALNLLPTSVNRDLMTYKGVLSKLSAAKELMQEYVEREKRKSAERQAEKAAKSSSSENGDGSKTPSEQPADVKA